MKFRSLVKDVFFFLYLHCGYVQVRDAVLRLQGRSRAVILCYHRVGGRDVLSKPAGEFRHDLNYLKRHYECVPLAELCRRLRGGEPLRRPLAAVTFDDGYRDNYVEAAPVLLAAGVPATFFVSTGYISSDRVFAHDARAGGSGDSQRECRYPKLSWEDLQTLQEAGFEIGSHTVEHTNLGKADMPTIEREVRQSAAMLDERLGTRPRAFAFPWGKPGDISDAAIAAIRECRYYAATAASGGINRPGDDVYRLNRIDAGNGHMSRMAVRARIAGFEPAFLGRAVSRLVPWKRPRQIAAGDVKNAR